MSPIKYLSAKEKKEEKGGGGPRSSIHLFSYVTKCLSLLKCPDLHVSEPNKN